MSEETLFQKYGKELPEGTVLFGEGEIGREIFVLQSGRVQISKRVRDIEKVLATLGPGEFFGEMAIISNKPRNATAVVTEQARVLVIDPRTFEAMIRGNAEIAVRLIKKLADRLSEADEQIENLLLADPASRIVHFVLSLCERRGAVRDGELHIEVPMRDLPRTLGVGEHAVYSVLDKLERGALIRRQGEAVTVPDPLRLREFQQYLEMKWKYGDV